MGAKGFVGKNLVAQLYNIKDNKARWYSLPEHIESIYECDIDTGPDALEAYCSDCSVVLFLDGSNDSKQGDQKEIVSLLMAKAMVKALKEHNKVSTIISGSVSRSKDLSDTEEVLHQYADDVGVKFFAYRFHKLFGKWCEPNTVSEVSTVCFNVANNVPFQIEDPGKVLCLNYIDDVVDELIDSIAGREHTMNGFGLVPTCYRYTLGEVEKLLQELDTARTSLKVPRVSDNFIKALYSTYLSYLPAEKVSYHLEMKKDDRGSFTEFIKTNNHGQISVNVSKPGITKGQHWHNNRVEKFLVVSGRGLLQQRKVGRDEKGQLYPVYESYVSSERMEVVEVRPGFTHNLINLSDTEDLVTIIWGNDCFDPNHPDTYSENV